MDHDWITVGLKLHPVQEGFSNVLIAGAVTVLRSST